MKPKQFQKYKLLPTAQTTLSLKKLRMSSSRRIRPNCYTFRFLDCVSGTFKKVTPYHILCTRMAVNNHKIKCQTLPLYVVSH
jgi:hypothetical protein